ncbi:MAG: isocitrate/isopropylmalate family dehydrogenase [Sedimentibacter sp.]|uniref:isocitrate/isopropylmalate family dehydrogenase n=1 Tax=Sedimentibacter sp. TaxID=1960295 RepID=UPI0031584E48
MEFNIALIKGDGIGPEISLEAVKVLEETGKNFRHNFNIRPIDLSAELAEFSTSEMGDLIKKYLNL